MKIISCESGPVATMSYVVFDETTNKAVVIDVPPESLEPIMKTLADNTLELSGIFLTHSHWDHCAEVAELKASTGAKVYIHKRDEYRLLDPMNHTIWPLPFDIKAVSPDIYFEDKQTIEIGELKFEIRETPGHTEGGVIIIEHNSKNVFSGDTIFFESVGRVDLPGGSMEKLIDSINTKVLSLGDDYKLYPGHGSDTSVGNERKYNPFLTTLEL